MIRGVSIKSHDFANALLPGIFIMIDTLRKTIILVVS